MAYTLDKGWKKQIESQMTTAIAFAENEEESFHIRALNEPMFSINDIYNSITLSPLIRTRE